MENLTKIQTAVNLSETFIEKVRDESKRKNGSEILACIFQRTNLPDRDRKALKLRLCGKTLIYAENPTGGDPILASAMRCGLRLCPSCSWKRAHQVFKNVHEIISHPAFADKRFLFLTLTVKNCEGGNLDGEIRRLLSGWHKITKSDKHQGFARSFAGTFRALEVTYNKLTKTFHPHLHAMAAVDPAYFKKSNPDYLSQPVLRELWKKSCGLDYLPQCRIERVRNSTRKQVAEVAKYTVKSADYLNRPEVLEVLDPALRGKRLIAYGGLFREVRDRLALPDEEAVPEDEFPRPAVDELLRNPYIRKIMLEWKMGAYQISVIEPSSDPAEWLDLGRVAAAALAGGARSWMTGEG